MVRTGRQYLDSLRDAREVFINGELVKEVRHPRLRVLIDTRARIYDMQHDAATGRMLTDGEDPQRQALADQLPRTQADSGDKRFANDAALEAIGGVTRFGGQTVSDMGSLFDSRNPFLGEADDLFDRVKTTGS